MKEELFFKNKLLNKTKISQKKIALTTLPRRLYVTLTNRCNLRCIMCDLYKNPRDVPERTLKEVWNGKVMQEYRKKLLNNCFDWCDYSCTSCLISQERLKIS